MADRHITDLDRKESLHADDLFLISTTDANGALVSNAIDFNDVFASLSIDSGQMKDGVLIGAFLNQHGPQVIGGPKTFTDEDFLKIQHQGATTGSLISGQTFNIHEYIVAAAPQDNLGDHTATEHLKMGDHCIVRSGNSPTTGEGLKIGADGSVSVGFDNKLTWDPSTEYPFTVKGNKSGTGSGKNYLVGFVQEGGGKSVLRCDAPVATATEYFIDGYINNAQKKFSITTTGSASFMGNMHVEGSVQFANGKFTISDAGVLNAINCTSSFGASSFNSNTTFKGATNFTNKAPVTFSSTTKFAGTSTFNSTANFAGKSTFTGGTEFRSTTQFNSSTTFKNPVTFQSSPVFQQDITLAPGKKIKDSSGNTASGSTAGNGLTKTAAGVMSVKFGQGGTQLGTHASVGPSGGTWGHSGLEIDTSGSTNPSASNYNPNYGGLQISSKESTSVQGNFHAIRSHPHPTSDTTREGGQLSLMHAEGAVHTGHHDFGLFDSFVDFGNAYKGIHTHTIGTDRATFPLIRCGHVTTSSTLRGWVLGRRLFSLLNVHFRNSDGNGAGCYIAGNGTGNSEICSGEHIFRSHNGKGRWKKTADYETGKSAASPGSITYQEQEINLMKIGYGGAVSSLKGFTGGLSPRNVSDRRLKKNIETIEADEALSVISKLRPVSFNWKKSDEASVGFISQEVEPVIPVAVETAPGDPEAEDFFESGGIEGVSGYQSLAYNSIIPYLCGAVQEQQKQIEELRKEIEELKNS